MNPVSRIAASCAVPLPPTPGAFKLAPRQALTLCPTLSGLLRVKRGRVWATFDGPHAGPLNDMGDHVLAAGERLVIQPGQRLVVESWVTGEPAYFTWDPLPSAVGRLAKMEARPSFSGWSRALWWGIAIAARGLTRLAERANGGSGRRKEPASACG